MRRTTSIVLPALACAAVLALSLVWVAASPSTGEMTEEEAAAVPQPSAGETTADEAATAPAPPATPEPEHVTVQHVLIGFSGSVPGRNITRSREEARKLAYEILERARKGESFGELVKKYTNDAPPGIYSIANFGVEPGKGEWRREGMVAAFGNIGFKLKVGEIGIADYDPQTSYYGWHVIKRLK